MSNLDYILIIGGLILILLWVPINSQNDQNSTASESPAQNYQALGLTTKDETYQNTASLNRPVLGGDCDYNIDIALQAIGGPVVIKPGHSWSFDGAIRPALNYSPRYCAGVYGGAWCNLADVYRHQAERLGLIVQWEDHTPPQNLVAIWLSETSNDQDLVITNNTDQTVVLEVQ